MKCLSIKQPWATAFVSGPKTFENRSWATSLRGPMLVHASASPDRGHALDFCRIYWRECPALADMPRGAIIGVVEIVACHWPGPTSVLSPWRSASAYGWERAADTLILTEPIPYRGQLGLFTVPDHQLTKEVLRWRNR